MDPRKQFIAARMKATKAFKTGDFTLSSGKKSDVYLDCRMLTLDSKSLPFIVSFMVETLDAEELEPNRVGGLSAGADPLIAGFLCNGWRSLKGFFARKEPKKHGTLKLVEGHLSRGDKVIIVDDVLTTGGSIKKCADDVIQHGGDIIGAIVIVDREEGGREALDDYRFPVYSLITLKEVREILGE